MEKGIRGLNVLQKVEAIFQGRHFLLRSQLTADASQPAAPTKWDNAYFAGALLTAPRREM